MPEARQVIEFVIKGTDKYSKHLGKAGNSISKLTNLTGKLTVGYTAAVSAISLFTTAIANSIDATVKFSNRIGVAVEQLSRMQFVAGQAGVPVTQFNLSVQRMTRRVAEATVGLGEAQGALRELGIDANRFSQLSLDDQFFTLAESLEKVKSESDKLRLAFKLFDSEGTAVLQMLKGGTEAMKEYAKRAEELGLVITPRMAQMTEKYTDSVGELSGAFTGLGRAISQELMPILTKANKDFANTIASWRTSIASFVRQSIFWFLVLWEVVKKTAQQWLGFITFSWDVWGKVLNSIISFVTTSAELFLLFGKSLFVGIWEGVKLTVGALKDLGVWIKDWVKSVFTRKEIDDFSDRMSSQLTTRFQSAMSAISADFDNVIKKFNEVGKTGNEVVTSILGFSMEQILKDTKAYIEELENFVDVKNEKIKESGKLAVESQTEVMRTFTAFVEELRFTMEDFLIQMMDLTVQVVQQVGDAVAASIVDGKKLSDALKGIIKGVLKTLISMLIQWMIKRLILSQLFGATVRVETAQEGAKAVGLAGANAAASMAAAPYPVNLTAPAFAALMTGVAAGALSSGMAIGGAIGGLNGIAHNGLTTVPREGTFLLDKGERVLSPDQNRDLTAFLQGGGNGGTSSVTIENVEIRILENATNADALLNMSDVEMEEIVAGPIISALNKLDNRGVRPNSIERKKF